MQSFSLPRAFVLNSDQHTLLQEVASHTDSSDAAEGILRSLERMGSDDSIRRYEITPTTAQRAYRGAARISWSVRAVRI